MDGKLKKKCIIKAKKVLTVLLVVIIASLTMPTSAMAMMSPSPQEMTVVVIGPPEDLEISIVNGREGLDDDLNARVSSRLWETYYRFFLCSETAGSWPYEDITILVSSEEYGEFSKTFPLPHSWRDFAIRLDLETQAISPAYSHGRNLIIVLCWLIPLFFIDSAIFFLYGHRKKESWKIFTFNNLIMQGLFIGVWSFFHIATSDILLALAIILFIPPVRILKWIAEIITYKNNVVETSRALECTVMMNLISIFVVIVLGIYIPFPGI